MAKRRTAAQAYAEQRATILVLLLPLLYLQYSIKLIVELISAAYQIIGYS